MKILNINEDLWNTGIGHELTYDPWFRVWDAFVENMRYVPGHGDITPRKFEGISE